MKFLRPGLLAAFFSVFGCLFAIAGWPEDEIDFYDLKLIQDAKISKNKAAIKSWLQERLKPSPDIGDVENLVKLLGDESFEKREQAEKALLLFGIKAVKALQSAKTNTDPEISNRAKKCLAIIAPNDTLALKAAAIRVFAKDFPAEFLSAELISEESLAEPFIAEALLDGMLTAYKVLPDETLAKARSLFNSKSQKVQILASWILGLTTKKITDLPNNLTPFVKLNLGYAMVQSQIKQGVDLIVEALPNLPPHAGWQAANLLCSLAGTDNNFKNIRQKQRKLTLFVEEFSGWWNKTQPKFDFPKNSSIKPTRVLASAMDLSANQGKIIEVRPDGSTKTLFSAGNYLNSITAVDHSRFIAREQGTSIAIWTIQGEMIERSNLERNFTFIGLDSKGKRHLIGAPEVWETDFELKPVSKITLGQDVGAAIRTANGELVAITKKGELLVFDRSNTANAKYRWENLGKLSTFQPIEPTGNDTFLIAEPISQEIREYTTSGKIVKSFKLQTGKGITTSSYLSFQALPNGNLLMGNRAVQNLSEINEAGEEIQSIPLDGRLRKLFTMPVRMVFPD